MILIIDCKNAIYGCSHLTRRGIIEFLLENTPEHTTNASSGVPQKYVFVVTPTEGSGLFFEAMSSVAWRITTWRLSELLPTPRLPQLV